MIQQRDQGGAADVRAVVVERGADAPAGYGPHKTIYNRFIRWSRLGVFNRIFADGGYAGDKLRSALRKSMKSIALFSN